MISKFIVKKMADKAICNENVKESWKAHEQVFGPILTPAFVNDSVARVRLTAALNALSGRDIDKAFKKLKTLQKYCVTDADKAAWLYFMGLCADLAGDRDAMIGFYAEAGTYQHRFYLPYLKLAKCALADGVFEIAEDNYRLAIRCLKDTELNTQSTEILLNAQSVDVLATAYTNLTSCLTMMHKYEAAQAALAASEKVLAVQPGRAATKAVLYAAMGKRTQAEECLSLLEKKDLPYWKK